LPPVALPPVALPPVELAVLVRGPLPDEELSSCTPPHARARTRSEKLGAIEDFMSGLLGATGVGRGVGNARQGERQRFALRVFTSSPAWR
jgi:hypothetical protein